ncbi:MAG: SpoIID/LytB domain-containing protein [Deltaproteobacteria bacterium]|nr:SpoIID/LytB domain-containing protein [Deltaproteobacteria bacterium]
MSEPTLQVGLIPSARRAEFILQSLYRVRGERRALPAGTRLLAEAEGGRVLLKKWDGTPLFSGATLELRPADEGRFHLLRMTVGIAFHWEHQEDLSFSGGIRLLALGDDLLALVNTVPLETYLASVISSEMSAENSLALLKAHAVISRSWLLAQLAQRDAAPAPPAPTEAEGVTRRIKWYDREDHERFDVCADDHCQRYQGVGRVANPRALQAVRETRGQVLVSGGAVCDARFSKSCGGVTARFSTAWDDAERPYLQSFPDRDGDDAVDLREESAAATFIEGNPHAWCNTDDAPLLARILPALDRGTRDFWRWEATVTPAQVRGWVLAKTGVELGAVRALRPLQRDPSGRLVLLAIEGEAHTLEVGKELEIRKLLSDTHLYSSAFTVHPEGGTPEAPASFRLVGAGWGHGVGLCQIGAAVMAESGRGFEEILSHYYRGAALEGWY